MSAPIEVTDPAPEPTEAKAPEAEETLEQKVARLENEAAETRREAAKYRTKAKEGASAAAELERIRDSQKTETEKVQERASKAEQRAQAAEAELIRERIARRHKIDDEDLDLLGTGTEEQLEARAKRLSALNAAAVAAKATVPPSEKPVEKLRPGATSTDDDITSPDAYPSSWRTAKTLQTRKD